MDALKRRSLEKYTTRAEPLFKLVGLVAVLGAFVPDHAVYLMVVPAVGITIYLTIYSYVEYRRVTT
ncbi:hypothetical protein GCM10009000_080340 [Halobacterium noricense]|uniref:Uncharacterized protein n=1 Tax=Haladaptatus pallidirubidus TaxID=1008152 RepID=A0AAV3UAC0_9EURY